MTDISAAAYSNLSRGEKKALKALLKLGLTPVEGITKLEIRRQKQPSVSVMEAVVFLVPGKIPSYVILGTLKVDPVPEDIARMCRNVIDSQAKAGAAKDDIRAPPTVVDVTDETMAEEEEVVDCSGVDLKDVEMGMEQTGRSKKVVVETLRETNGDIVEAIMKLTS